MELKKTFAIIIKESSNVNVYNNVDLECMSDLILSCKNCTKK